MKSQSGLLVLALMLFAQVSWASRYNYNCRFAYREAAVLLLDHISEFKAAQIGSTDEKDEARGRLAVQTTNLDVEVGITRTSCAIFETAENRSCVEAYKEIYDNLRNRISVPALAAGNQQDVSLNVLERTRVAAEVGYRDLRCGYEGKDRR
ncbi:MAG: hypothetical protein ACK5Y2_07305 [Bdellovibrionales bacterium]